MRTDILLNTGWMFSFHDGSTQTLDLPHTWNAHDGQNGGNDYWRGTNTYEKRFPLPDFDPKNQQVYLEFRGVNASAKVVLNGHTIATHDGGYSTFRVDVTDHLMNKNHLQVEVDNAVNDRVYPQTTVLPIYGGIYRDVLLRIVHKHHFDMDYFGGPGIAVQPTVTGSGASIKVRSWHNTPDGTVNLTLLDAEGQVVGTGTGTDCDITVERVHLWNGVADPYLYTCKAVLMINGKAVDEISTPFGVRFFHVDPEDGFFLNGRPYSLHFVSRHQDWKGFGNALTRDHHDTDMELIREMGGNAIHLAYYQQDQYFYDLCDRYGMVVWTEIPYFSAHMPSGRENTVSQLKELIVQNYNHPSICVWGLSNDVATNSRHRKDMLDNHRSLNDLCHEMDPSRPTILVCRGKCGPFSKAAHITDIVSRNQRPGIGFFHKVSSNRALGCHDGGCYAMTSLHTSKPRRNDRTEESQMLYHEALLKYFQKHPFMWATHGGNMFDFAANGTAQGDEPGINHSGLVTFDRKIKKDSFYLYKAWWSKEPFVHICGSRYTDRCEKVTVVKVCSNQKTVTLLANGKEIGTREGNKIFRFKVPLDGTVKLEAISGQHRDTATIRRMKAPR